MRKAPRSRFLRLAAAATLLSYIAAGVGWAAPKPKSDPRRAAVAAGPDMRATRTVTNFAEALSCMDDLLLQYGKRDIAIINDGIPDATATLRVGTRDMVISALDAMSLKSGAFKYVDADQSDENIRVMQLNVNGSLQRADYYIKGSISQIDQEVLSSGKRMGIATDFLSVGASKDRSVTNIALELGMYRTSDRTLIRGVRTQNTIQVVRKGKGMDVGGLLPFASLVYEVHSDRAQGSHQTVRTLVELSLIELVGKFTKVPYWRCLALPSADPMARHQADDYYARMRPAEQIMAAQTALQHLGYYRGQFDGVQSPQLGQAISRYRVENGLGPGPHVDFELYFSFLTKGLVANGDAGAKQPRPILAPAVADDGLGFEMVLNDLVPQGSELKLELTPKRNAYFYCFMAGNGKEAFRIYPNRFTGDQPMTLAGATLRIPAIGDKLAIRLNDVGIERVACIARAERYEVPPPSLAATDLSPIVAGGKLAGLDSVINEHQKRDAMGLNSSVQVKEIQVTRASASR